MQLNLLAPRYYPINLREAHSRLRSILRRSDSHTSRGSRVRKLLMGLVVAAAVSLSMPLAASAAEYETFVGCDDLAANPTPSHVCHVGDFPGAFLESDTDTIFEFCLEFPTEEILCTEEEFAEAGTLSAISLPADIQGNYFALWFVGEEVIGAWEFRMESPPPPPPAPPAAS